MLSFLWISRMVIAGQPGPFVLMSQCMGFLHIIQRTPAISFSCTLLSQ